MIPKINSQEINDILLSAKDEIYNIEKSVNIMKKDIEEKLFIINHENNYISNLLSSPLEVKNILAIKNNNQGDFEKYGVTSYPTPLKELNNIYNLRVMGNGKYFFREDAKAYYSFEAGSYDDIVNKGVDCSDILKHDSLENKNIFFIESDKDNLALVIKPDVNNLLGNSYSNVIEIDPFLSGSFDIKQINIFAEGDLLTPKLSFSNIEKVGKIRLVWEEPINISLISFQIKLNYRTDKNNKNIYPFGLKHIYLYEAAFSANSYTVIEYLTDEYISYFSDEYTAVLLTGEELRYIEADNIEVYIDKELRIPVFPNNEIARNTKSLYIKIPLKFESIIGYKFKVENRK